MPDFRTLPFRPSRACRTLPVQSRRLPILSITSARIRTASERWSQAA